MKGVLICGGTGTRLRPLTDVTNKSLLPVYDKPLILYPLQTLRDADITDIAVISGTEHIDQMQDFLGTGERFGCTLHYLVQQEAGGIAQALGLSESFADGESVCVLLGDNVFFDDLSETIKSFKSGGHIFLKEVPDPERFGIAEIAEGKVISIEEKPRSPKGNLAQTGCYLYDNRCFDVIKLLKPSNRGELEITDITRWYLEESELGFTILHDDWIDAGQFETLFTAAKIVRERKKGKEHK